MLTIYLIECLTTGKKYYGTTKSQNQYYNPTQWLTNQSESTGNYTSLAESVKLYGLRDHETRLIPCDYDDDTKLEKVYKMIVKLQKDNRSLNDIAIPPKKVECPNCKQSVREFFLKEHDAKYCKAVKKKADYEDLLEV